MPSKIKTETDQTVTAFTADGSLIMNFGSPIVSWSFSIKHLEDWLTTLEEVMLKETNMTNRYVLERLYFGLKAAHKRHLAEHEQVITEAPTEDDLMSYLTAYSAAMAWEAMEGRK